MEPPELTKEAWIQSALARYEQPLLRYAYRFTGNAEVAREVVQDAFLKLCAAQRHKVDGHLAAWLYTVCRNRALNVQKKEARMQSLSEAQAANLPDPGAGPDGLAMQNDTRRKILQLFSGLPEAQQEACRLKFEDGLTYREISQVMGRSLGAVSNLLAAALDTVREQLRNELDLPGEAHS